MKVAQLEAGRVYVNKKGDQREIRQISKGRVYYLEKHFICNCDAREFAAWAKTVRRTNPRASAENVPLRAPSG
ncbi:hypothetical protein [Thioalkalivibrio thiocyanodenitrificans]|uniref:hypothetical protein n=1 Tax=Thioalkalivibrio thiocyanodenitrificans TaxID=243063 RepID=UPI000375644B|nr:hypothetical protein [Thioalkalivibrio thiocyanodenitrificans]